MTITKFGHCCLLLEIAEKRILVDPGRFSTGQNFLTEIDIILITHEHADHYHSDSVAAVLKNNPNAIVVTNSSVAKLLKGLGVEAHILEGRSSATVVNIHLAAYDGEHVEIFEDFSMVQNTGYLVAGKFFFPGDAYTVPEMPVDILALPVAGPWCKVSDAINFALKVKPRVAIPVHDATLSELGRSVTYPHFTRVLTTAGIEFVILEPLVAREF
ncbi:MAG: MBL fold metallo-hydrolase [Patescibacteria group bacterium]